MQQLCDTDGDGGVDQEPIMLSLVVVNKGTGPGDATWVYEGIPVNRPSHLIGSQQRSHQDCSGGFFAFIRGGYWLEVKAPAKVGSTNRSSGQGATSRGFVVSLRPELSRRRGLDKAGKQNRYRSVEHSTGPALKARSVAWLRCCERRRNDPFSRWLWLGDQDSNLDFRIQSPASCR